ncbi:globin domain-containing protein [Nisaea acidiphila]|uniref:Globin domain-containing protein n=1 Tax=Nisaea acidiphila TaxID=1862145 RepID=A0A9J7ASL9_9PROT|nr:globin family protein [Nisaea acidiphila]UUX49497.1 globin domain-containing protein [Nisaea acidiphila]
MSLTSEQVTLIQKSFAKVAPIKEPAAELFYGRLFEVAPEVRALFKSDLKEQGAKLMATLAMVVAGLGALETVVPVARKLAQRHVGYGVTEEHYAPVGSALLWTLEKGLGDDFAPEVEQAWASAYGLLSEVMIEAAYRTAPNAVMGVA